MDKAIALKNQWMERLNGKQNGKEKWIKGTLKPYSLTLNSETTLFAFK